VICTQWPQQEFKIKGIKGTERTEVSFLGYDTKVNWKISEEGMIIQPPALSPATIPCSYAWVFKIENVVALDSAKR
jgi:alpha-L-fucosidase